MTRAEKTRVLVLERETAAREAMVAYFEKRPDIRVAGAYPGAQALLAEAAIKGERALMDELRPDVIVTDARAPLHGDLLSLARLREIAFSPMIAFTSCDAREAPPFGVAFFDVVRRPPPGDEAAEIAALRMLTYAVRRARLAASEPEEALEESAPQPAAQADGADIIAVGASMGGTEAIVGVLSALPRGMPPILVVQHLTRGFAELFARHIDAKSRLTAKVAEDGEAALPDRAYVAPDGAHLTLERSAGAYMLRLVPGARVTGHLPSIDALFASVAEQAGARAVGVLLTGMGRDGAAGLLRMREAGALTIGQDEETSLMYGMPKAAFELGAVRARLPLPSIADELIRHALSAQVKRR